MPQYRVCRSFVVESGHMLSKHQESCRFPHGHTRTIEIVVASESLDENDMVVDFKAIKLAFQEFLDKFDHSMCLNSEDPLAETLSQGYPSGTVIFTDQDPTTEVLAKHIFDYATKIFSEGFEQTSDSGSVYKITAGSLNVNRVRVSETPNSWAEYGI